MPDTFDFSRMLEEIIEDEKVTTSKRKRVSQGDIRRLLSERQQVTVRAQEAETSRIGELLVQHSLISPEQLRSALLAQTQKGGKLGSLLVELGHISATKLVEFLGKQHSVPRADLFQIASQHTLTSLLPHRIILKHRVLPLGIDGATLQLAMENPHDHAAVHEVEFLTGKRVVAVVAASYQIDLALKCIDEKGGLDFSTLNLQTASQAPVSIEQLLDYLIQSDGSDLFLSAGLPPSVKAQNVLQRCELANLTADQCVAYAKALMSEIQWEQFLQRKELHFTLQMPKEGRFRITAYRQRNAISLTIRRIGMDIPGFEELGLPDCLRTCALRPAAERPDSGVVAARPWQDHDGGGDSRIDQPTETGQHRDPGGSHRVSPRAVESHDQPAGNPFPRRFILGRPARPRPAGMRCGHGGRTERSEDGGAGARSGGRRPSGRGRRHRPECRCRTGKALIARCPARLHAQLCPRLADTLLLVFAQTLIPRSGQPGMVLAGEKLLANARTGELIRHNKLRDISATGADSDADYRPLSLSLAQLISEDRITVEEALNVADQPGRPLAAGGIEPSPADGTG